MIRLPNLAGTVSPAGGMFDADVAKAEIDGRSVLTSIRQSLGGVKVPGQAEPFGYRVPLRPGGGPRGYHRVGAGYTESGRTCGHSRAPSLHHATVRVIRLPSRVDGVRFGWRVGEAAAGYSGQAPKRAGGQSR